MKAAIERGEEDSCARKKHVQSKPFGALWSITVSVESVLKHKKESENSKDKLENPREVHKLHPTDLSTPLNLRESI